MRLNIEMKSSDELASVPTNIIEKLSAADLEAYRNPVVYFRSAAERTGINELQQLFENDVSDGQIAHIRIEYDLVAEVNMWFSFTLVKRKCSPWYCSCVATSRS